MCASEERLQMSAPGNAMAPPRWGLPSQLPALASKKLEVALQIARTTRTTQHRHRHCKAQVLATHFRMAKRKLNEHDVPEETSGDEPQSERSTSPESSQPAATATEPVTTTATPKNKKSTKATKAAEPTPFASFAELQLEPRLLRAIRDLKWASPTAVQSQAIPLALEGRDILARSGTGTGKTAAYLLPILHKTLQRKQTSLILAPTRELCQQIANVAKSLAQHCSQEIRVRNIAGKESDAVVKAALADKPEVVVATPARAWTNINNSTLAVNDLGTLVVDEGDLINGYGFAEDMTNIAREIPVGVQKIVLSATLSTDVEALGSLLCIDPVILKLADLDKDSKRVSHIRISSLKMHTNAS